MSESPVEAHYAEGVIADAARDAAAEQRVAVHSLTVRKKDKSGKAREHLNLEEMVEAAIA